MVVLAILPFRVEGDGVRSRQRLFDLGQIALVKPFKAYLRRPLTR